MVRGVLLVNLGTPDSPSNRDVYKYLDEFLMDPRVMDIPWLARQLLVRGNIVPRRFRNTARTYRAIWSEDGSPLLYYSREVKKLLQKELGEEYAVELGMRYQNPSLLDALDALQKKNVEELIILPLFPQYASATTGSVHQKVMEIVKGWQVIPAMRFISSYAQLPPMIQAFADNGRKMGIEGYDHVIFSFHGLPERQLIKADSTGCCLKQGCCDRSKGNSYCYKAECMRTARAIAAELALQESGYTIAFQSRLGKTPWTTPFLTDVIKQRFEEGDRSLLVYSPSFVCDCLETIFEIRIEYAEEFHKMGGKRLDLVDGLNTHPLWISALKQLVCLHEFANQKH